MHTDQASKEKSNGRANYLAGRDVPGGCMYLSTCDVLDLDLDAVRRTYPDDGSDRYYAQRWGLVRNLARLQDATRDLAQDRGTS